MNQDKQDNDSLMILKKRVWFSGLSGTKLSRWVPKLSVNDLFRLIGCHDIYIDQANIW